MHIERGREIELPFDLPITKLPKNEYLKYSVFFGQQPMLVPIDSDQGRQIVAEKERAKKLEAEKVKEANKAIKVEIIEANEKWHQKPFGIIFLTVLALTIAAIVWVILQHYFPKLHSKS